MLYGTCLLTFFVTNIPLNVSLVANLILGKIPNALTYFVVIIVIFGKFRWEGFDDDIGDIEHSRFESGNILSFSTFYLIVRTLLRSDHRVDLLPPGGRPGHHPIAPTLPTVQLTFCSLQGHESGESRSHCEQHPSLLGEEAIRN